jgi:drug/metabolite transporter (DMT)-like permease
MTSTRSGFSPIDIAATTTCALVWGTSWYAITLQLGVVDPIVSLVYRFSLAAAMLFLWCRFRGEPIALSFDQHKAAAGVGLFSFTIDYSLTYFAEAHVVSGIVAVLFATLAFVNLVLFRIVFQERAPRGAWAATAFGIVGVALLSQHEIVNAAANVEVSRGFVMAFAAVVAAAFGNLYARRGEEAGAPLRSSLAWSMAYGVTLLALLALATGRRWTIDIRPAYLISLLYLAVAASRSVFPLPM